MLSRSSSPAMRAASVGSPSSSKPHAEIGAADAPARIDARPQHEAEMPGFRRTAQARHVHQRRVADVIASPQCDQALRHQRAIEPRQRRDVGDRAERDMMQRAEQIRLGPLVGPEAALPQLAIDRHQRHEHEADCRELAETGQIVGPVRIHQRIDDRQFVAALMMVDHQHVEAEPLCLSQRLDAGGAAIHRDQQRRAFGGQRPHRLDVRPIAFEDAVGNVDQRIEAGVAQMPGEQRRRRRAIDIVVAEDRNAFALASQRRRCALIATSMSVTVNGSGISLRTVGSRKSATASSSTPRPASTRASISGS